MGVCLSLDAHCKIVGFASLILIDVVIVVDYVVVVLL